MSQYPIKKREVSNGQAIFGAVLLIGIFCVIMGWYTIGGILIVSPFLVTFILASSQWEGIKHKWFHKFYVDKD